MITVLHTADLHLDSPFSGSGLTTDQARQRRADLTETFVSICQAAKEHQADLLVIAGDLFDEEYLRPETLRTITTTLEGLEGLPVLISPGNHDPYHASSPYRVETWPENVHIFNSLEPAKKDFEALSLTAHGCAFTGPHVTRPAWQRFRIEHTRTFPVNIIVTHGAFYEGEPGQAANYLPISREELLATEADYVALGHYHRGFTAVEDKFTQSVRAAYPGSPEPLRWGACDDHGPLLVTIDEDSKKVTAERLPLARRRYHEFSLDAGDLVTSRDYQVRIGELISEHELGERDLVRLTITGRHDPQIPVDPEAIVSASYPLFALTIVNTARPDYDIEAIASERSVRGMSVKELLNLAENGEGDEREVAREALNLALGAFDGINPEEVPL